MSNRAGSMDGGMALSYRSAPRYVGIGEWTG